MNAVQRSGNPGSRGFMQRHMRARLIGIRGVLVALDVDELPELVPDLDKVRGITHHLVDRLVGGRDLVDEGVAGPEFDALHGGLQLGEGEGLF